MIRLSETSSRQTLAWRAILAATLILLAAGLRIAPHPWNFTPIGAMALFSGAIFRDRRIAFLFPLLALFAGDLFVGLHRLIPVVYASFLFEVWIGTWLKERRGILRIAIGLLLGALQFFLITNFAIWRVYDTYPHTPAGLLACYIAGLPYFGNTLLGDMVYAAFLFGSFALSERFFPALREPLPSIPT
jgi:hypothetical protein